MILGYGLGDVNVLSAVDWSQNIYNKTVETNAYPHDIVQVVRVTDPKPDPYIDKNGIIIIETDEIINFLGELETIMITEQHEYDELLEEIKEINEELTKENDNNVDRFINEATLRLQLLEKIDEFSIHMILPFIDFLRRCIDKTWENSIPYGAFKAYDDNLKILLDITIHIEFNRMPPTLFEFVARSLDRVLGFVGYSMGKSHQAEDTWRRERDRIPKKMLEELYKYSERQKYNNLHRKLKSIMDSQSVLT